MLKIFASTVAKLDSNVYTGGGTDVTEALQAVLDRAPEENGVHLVVDGAALIHGLKVHSNTIIECIGRTSGFYMADNVDRPMLTNADWSVHGSRNSNISLIGGTYNHNCKNQRHHVTLEEYPYPDISVPIDPTYAGGHGVSLMEFYGMEDFVIRDVILRNQRTYALFLCNFENVLIENTAIDTADYVRPSNQDGFHFFGPGRFLTMRNIRGCSGDDFINLAADEFDGISSITDVLIDGVFLDNTHQGIRMLCRNKGLLDRVTVRNVTGSYEMFAFSIIPFLPGNNFGNFGDIFIENVELRQVPAKLRHSPLTFFQVGGNIKSMTLKNFRFHMPVRNHMMLDVGRPFFYRPQEMTSADRTEQKIEKELVPNSTLVPDWMPEAGRPRIGTFVVDGLTVISDENADGMNIMELRHRIDNCIVKNVQVFRTEEASADGTLISLKKEANIGNLIVEDVFAQKLDRVLSAGTEHKVDCLRVDNVVLRDGGQVLDVENAQINRVCINNINNI